MYSLLLAGCHKKTPSSESKEEKLHVLVTIAPYAYFVDKLAGEYTKTAILIPPNANPHIYEPNPKQMDVVLKTHLWFGIGEPLEKKLAQTFLTTCPDLHYIDLTQNIELIHDHDGCTHNHIDSSIALQEGADRHVWLSIKLAKQQAEEIATALAEQLPEHAGHIRDNLQSLLQKMDQADLEISSLLAPIAGRGIIVSHPAFAYFCHDYHLFQLSVECEGKDPLPQDVQNLIVQAEEKNTICVLILAQYNTKPSILIADKLGLPVFQVDPYARNYLENLKDIATKIADSATIH